MQGSAAPKGSREYAGSNELLHSPEVVVLHDPGIGQDTSDADIENFPFRRMAASATRRKLKLPGSTRKLPPTDPCYLFP